MAEHRKQSEWRKETWEFFFSKSLSMGPCRPSTKLTCRTIGFKYRAVISRNPGKILNPVCPQFSFYIPSSFPNHTLLRSILSSKANSSSYAPTYVHDGLQQLRHSMPSLHGQGSGYYLHCGLNHLRLRVGACSHNRPTSYSNIAFYEHVTMHCATVYVIQRCVLED